MVTLREREREREREGEGQMICVCLKVVCVDKPDRTVWSFRSLESVLFVALSVFAGEAHLLRWRRGEGVKAVCFSVCLCVCVCDESLICYISRLHYVMAFLKERKQTELLLVLCSFFL